MTLEQLLPRAMYGSEGVSAHGDLSVVVHGATQDSRRVQPGWLYVARKGVSRDGHEFVAAAVAQGASALLVERLDEHILGLGVPIIRVPDARLSIGPVAHALAGDPTERLAVFGITGTNGKTTTSFLLRQLLALTGPSDDCAVVGTLGTFVGAQHLPSAHTTPEADVLAHQFGAIEQMGAKQVAMEVSSIALSEGRLCGTHFDTVAFTNLSQDHLDYHGSMDAYLAAKVSLFVAYPSKRAVVCIDGPAGMQLRDLVSALSGKHCRTVSTVPGSGADLILSMTHSTLSGMRVLCVCEGARLAFSTPLVGAYNLENLAVAFGIALGQGRTIAALASAAAHLHGVPGRMERVTPADHPFAVVVDYSHTPDALERALMALRPSASAKVRLVFGCGGDRDRGKRPLMGGIAAKHADCIYLADDNPRSERAEDILDAIEQGIPAADRARVQRIGERAHAIRLAIHEAAPGDVLLIAGKGHETTQTVGSEVFPFDDREVAREALSMRPVG